jgi:tRNA(fMet)-specific endonuclease VapC
VYLLDTNACIQFLRDPDSAVALRLASVPFGEVTLCRQGQLIGPNDLLIAATALAYEATLVTHNTREFARVPDLQIEDWEG